MYKDFKKSESLDTGFVGGSGIIWMFSGVVLGLLVGFGMYHFSNNNASVLSMAGTVEDKIKRVQTANQKLDAKNIARTSANKTRVLYKPNSGVNKNQQIKKEPRQHKFSYYAVLPKIDVPVNSSRPINNNPKKSVNNTLNNNSVPSATSQNQQQLIDEAIAKRKLFKEDNIGDYLLQVASYKKKSRANVTRGRLSKSGIDAYVQAKKVKGRLWYRVIAGPVDQDSVSSWKHTAEKMGHRPLVISVR